MLHLQIAVRGFRPVARCRHGRIRILESLRSGLQLFIGTTQLFVRTLEFLGGGLILLDGRAKELFCRFQLFFERVDSDFLFGVYRFHHNREHLLALRNRQHTYPERGLAWGGGNVQHRLHRQLAAVHTVNQEADCGTRTAGRQQSMVNSGRQQRKQIPHVPAPAENLKVS